MDWLRIFSLGMVLLGLWVCPAKSQPPSTIASQPSVPFDREAAARDLAATAVRRSIDALGHPGGFYLTPEYHIALSDVLKGPVKTLKANYAGAVADAVERTINQAAEKTATPAGEFILKELPRMTLSSPEASQGVALTGTLKALVGSALHEAMRPIMNVNLTRAGGDEAFQRMQMRYEALANGPLPKFDFQAYALDRFIDKFFLSVADEEQTIRSRPSLQTTDAVRRAVTQ